MITSGMGLTMGLRLGAPNNRRSLLQQALSAIRRNGGTLIGIPDSFAGAYIESDGTRPVTAVGDVLGLLTDRSYGAGNLGVELAGLGTAWSSLGTGITQNTGAGTLTFTAVAAGQAAYRGLNLTAGKTYQIEFVVSSISGGGLQMVVGGGAGTAVFTVPGTYRAIVKATAPDGPYIFAMTSAVTAVITSASCREVLGNHATQPTTASKPTVAVNAQGKKVISFDGSNDFLQTGITTGNAGWICAGVTFGGAAAANETVFEAGAVATTTNKGFWLFRWGNASANWLEMRVGNGATVTTKEVSTIPLLGVPRVVEGGWDASTVLVGVDGVISTKTRTGDASPSGTPLRIGAYQGAANFLQGGMSVQVICPTLPPAADRALIRQFVGSLQGQTL